MKNLQKTNVKRLGSVEIKKTVSVMKCFICNQLQYSQKTFEEHIKVHQSKLSKNVTEDFKRKTMEQFKIKKNPNTSTSKQLGALGKKKLNQTTTAIRPNMIQQDEYDEQQDDLNRQQLKEVRQTLRKSTLLIQKLQAILHEQPQKPKEQQNIQPEQEQASESVKLITEQEFLQMVLTKTKISCKQAEQTKFTNEYLQSHQDQLLYLRKMASYLQKDQINLDKYQKMTSNILQAMIKYVNQNAVVEDRQQQYIKQEQGLYLTHIPEKQTKSQKQIIEEQERGVEIVENQEVTYCNECYMMIEYGEDCFRERIPTKTAKNIPNTEKPPRSFHTDCWQQRHEQNFHQN